MLVKKNGIFRNIDERKLGAYKEKGFAPVQTPEKEAPKAKQEPAKGK